MGLSKRQKDDYYWIVQRCLVEFFGKTSLEAKELVLWWRDNPYETIQGHLEVYQHLEPWQHAILLAEGKEALTPEEQVVYDKIVEEVCSEDFLP